MEKMTNTPQDWELSEDFYSQEEGKKWKLEDIMVCLQAFPEDNPVAVARLIVLG